MTSAEIISLGSSIVSLLIVAGLVLGRHWLVTWITGRVQHSFNTDIEKLKAELRVSEAEVSALRANVFSGSSGRQALLDKRRFQAVENVWKALNDLAQYKHVSSIMSMLQYDKIAERIEDPKIQRFLDLLGGALPDHSKHVNVARDEQPYLPDLAWAYFTAYQTILLTNYSRFQVLKLGIADPQKIIDTEGQRKILKAALPQFSDFIDKNEPGSYHHLLAQVEKLLLSDLRAVLSGKEADRADAIRTKEINDAVKEVVTDSTRAAVHRLPLTS